MYAMSAFFRVIATFSSKTALTRLVLYVQAMEPVFKALVTVYRVYLASEASTADQCVEIIATTFPSTKVMLVYSGGFAVIGLGLKMILNEIRDRDEWVLQCRRETIETLAEKDGRGSSGSMDGDEQGRVDDQEKEKEEMQLHTLFSILGKEWFGLGIHFRA